MAILAGRHQGASASRSRIIRSSGCVSMGKFDCDYLWLAEPPRRSWRLHGLVAFLTIPLIYGAIWIDIHLWSGLQDPQTEHAIRGRETSVHRPTRHTHPAQAPLSLSASKIGQAARADSTAPGVQATPTNRTERLRLRQAIASPEPQATDDRRPEPGTPFLQNGDGHTEWHQLVIRPGDTLSIAFNRAGLSYMDSLKITHLPRYGSDFTTGLAPGDAMRVLSDGDGHVQAMDFPVDALHTLEIRREGDEFNGRMTLIDVTHRQAYVSGVIHSSFYTDALAAGLTANQLVQLNHIFDWDIDFTRDVQPGDRFAVIYDQLYRYGRKIENGPILAAALFARGHEIRALRFVWPDGGSAYYSPDGRAMKKGFTRAPADYTRISSGFNAARMHPILHRIRRHEGTDYAAPEGTPIHATGDGRIIFRGRRGGYGNMIIIRHRANLSTRYGHMSAFASGLGVGSAVKQGDVIGYVGMTGLATGPHVHYEVRIDGQPRNPQTVPLPQAQPLPRHYLARFKRHSAPLLSELDTLDDTRLARTDTTTANTAN